MKKRPFLNKIFATLAFIIGVMAIFAGGKVLLETLPDYYMINWLPDYNFIICVVSASFSTVVIWGNGKLSLPTVVATLGLHAVVMLVLRTVYHNVVAPDSNMAMTVHLTIWMIILILMIIQQRKQHSTPFHVAVIGERYHAFLSQATLLFHYPPCTVI